MKATVLIVDDSLTVRMDLAEAFTQAGLASRPCGSLAEARVIASEEPVDLMVLDLLLPDGDGLDLLQELRTSYGLEGTPAMLLSTEADVAQRVRGVRMGADDYVGKPYDRAYVVSRALELLGARALLPVDLPTILVIDDSATFRAELAEALGQAGYRVVTADTGEEGLRLAAARRPAAILVDGVLPGIDGPTVIRRIRLDEALRHTPCLLLTASLGSQAELRALDSGADAFVRKEDDLLVVLARLAAILRSAGTEVMPAARSLLGPRRILAVDDSPTYLHFLSDALREDGYDVVLAKSGEEALEMLATQPVDCILLDLQMPGLSGTQTCAQIKKAPGLRDIPLLMLTALEDRQAMIDGLGAGADDYIPKSAPVDVLKARVRAQIRRKQFEDENRRIREELLRREVDTVRERAARELAETRAGLVEQLEQKNQELEAFSYSVSHDLRAPLRSIDGFSHAILEDCAEQLDDRGKDHLRRVRGAARRMTDLIDALLELSRVGRAELSFESVDLSALALRVLAELARQEPTRQVVTEVQPGMQANADPRLVVVVLDNLLGNAWKYSGKTAAARIEMRTETTGGELVYLVRDNGVGFDMAHATRLFQPFQRLHGQSDFPGTGIGLATVRRIVERHGGRVWAESAPGAGTVIFFTLQNSKASR
jgi:two-component system, NtrC family, sensor kinase